MQTEMSYLSQCIYLHVGVVNGVFFLKNLFYIFQEHNNSLCLYISKKRVLCSFLVL